MAEKGITLYFVGCEPSVLPYKDFYTGLAFITGGQYVPLQNPEALSKVSWKNYQEFSVVHCYPSSTTFSVSDLCIMNLTGLYCSCIQ